MPLSDKLPEFIHRTRIKTQTRKFKKSAPLVVGIALLAAVAFSVSVESRSAGWFWKTQPSVSPSKPEPAKTAPSSVAVKPLSTKPTLAPFAPTVTATKTDTLFTDVDLDGKADPGDTLKYTVQISATGEDATGVTFTDTVDPNTAFVNGTLRTTPLARPDSYTATGNVRIQVPAPGVLANDQDFDGVGPAISVTAGVFLSAQGGNVDISADGSFKYNPPAGYEGPDSFTYTLNDNDTPNQTDTGTVSITVSGMIWFINNQASCPCDGRLTNPFNTLAAFNAVNDGVGNHPAANDNIFVYESSTDYVGPVTLLNGQKFIGQDATASLATIAGITLAPNSDPLPATNSGNGTIVNITSAGNGINVGQNNTLRGFTGGNAGTDISGSGFGTLNASDITLSGNGQTLSLTNGTLNGTFASLSSASSATTGLSLSTVAGSLSSGSTTVSGSTGIGISVGTSSATLNFANTSVSTSGGTGVSLLTNTGTITFGDLDVSPNTNQKGLLATDNTNTITATSGTFVTNNAAAVEITRASGTTPLNVTLTSVSTTNGPNSIILSSTSGSFTVAGNGGVCTEASPGTCSGGQIQNINTGADTNPVTTLPPGTGIALRNASNVSLTRIRINNTNNYGIDGTNVTNFTMANSVIQGTNGTNVSSPFRDSSMRFDQLTGTNSITNSFISGGFQHNLLIDNQSGTSQVTVSGTSIHNTSAVVGDDGFQLEAESTAVVNAFITNNSFAAHGGDHFNLSLINSADVDLTFTGNAFAGGHAVGLGQGLFILGSTFNGTFNYDISNNGTALAPLTGNKQGGMIHVNKGSGTGTFSGRIQNNFIGNAAIVASGSEQAFGIYASARGAGGGHTTLINNNTVRQYFDRGILMEAGEGAASLDATVTNNTVSDFADAVNSLHGIHSDNGILSTDTNAVCMDIRANSVATAGNEAAGGSDIRLRKGSQVGLSVRIPNLVGTTAANAQAKIAADNPTATTVTVTGANFTDGGNCATATLPAAPLGPITAGSLSAESTTQQLQTGVQKSANVLYAAWGENKNPQNVVSLTQSEVSAMAQAALTRWSEFGLSAKDFARLQSFSYDIADLPDGQLATLKDNTITLDTTAAGYGWYFDSKPTDDNEFDVPVPNQELQATEYSDAHARFDLLTVLMHELGSTLKQSGGKTKLQGPQRWLMENTLEPGTRRAPVFKIDIGKVSAPKTGDAVVAANSRAAKQATDQEVASLNTSRNSRGTVRRHHANLRPATPMFSDVSINIGVLPAGKTITITFNATVDDPFPGPGAQVCNQGSVSVANLPPFPGTVLTDDPDVVGAANPTCTAIDLQADLEITAKTDTPDPVIAGNNLTYTINFINNGPNASGATLTDATPAGTTFVSAQVLTGTGWGMANPGVGNTGNVEFSKPLVASGETASFEIVVHVNSSVANGSTITNTASVVTSGATDPVPGNNSKTSTTSVIAQADLSITKTDGATTEIPGTSISYTIVVTNSGPSDANGVSVADTFPSDLTGVTFTSSALGGATGNTAAGAGNISDTLNMPTGSSVTYTVNATIKSSATGTLSNTATVTAPVGVTDPDTANNSATDNDTLTPQADLSITKTDGAPTEIPGTSITYTIVVSNSGPSDAPGTAVADLFPATLTGVTFTSVAAGSATGNTAAGAGNINDTVSLPSGSSVTYTVNATIQSSATGSLSNTATVTEGAGVTDNNQANNSATDTDTLTPQADLSITKTDGVTSKVPGTSVTYTIVVTNNGPSDAPGTSVADTFPGILTGVTFTSVSAGGATGNTAAGAGNISDTLSMPAGSSVTYTVNATIQSSATGSLSNTATVTAGAGVTDPTPGNNSATDTDTLTPSADVSVTKTDSPDPVVVDNNITYTITVTNNGPSDAQSLSLSDAVPANTTLFSVTTPAGWTRTDAVPNGGTGTLTFTRPTLAAGASSIFTVVVHVNAGTANGTTITNTANVSSTTADPTPGNNSATATTLVQSNADVAISKTRSPNTASIDAGNNVTYTVQVINNGPAAASSVTFSDSVPAGLEVVSQSNPAGWSCNTLAVGGNGTITCTKASMANGETATLTVVAKVSCSTANGATIMNSSSISAVSPSDNVPGNNSSSTSFTVNNPAVTVSASVTISQLPQNSHDLINVGLAALAAGGTTNCPPGPLTVFVFGDEDDQTPTANNEVFSPDAKDIGVGTLRLRGERVNSGNGRVYLIVVKSGSSFATVTVVVPKSSSAANVNAVIAEAAAAKAFADSHNGAAPAGYFVIGDGPVIGNKQ